MVQSAAHEPINDLQSRLRQSAAGHDALQCFVATGLGEAGAEVSKILYRVADIGVKHELGTIHATNHAREKSYEVGSYGNKAGGLLLWAHSDSEPVNPAGWKRPLIDCVIEQNWPGTVRGTSSRRNCHRSRSCLCCGTGGGRKSQLNCSCTDLRGLQLLE